MIAAVVIQRSVRDHIVRHACAEFPREAVGLLAALEPRTICLSVPLRNIAPDPERRFLADPHSQFLAERSLRAAGLKAAGIYHSHPGGALGLSEDDLSFARLRGGFQLIVAPSDERDAGAAIKVFECRGERTNEVKVRFEG
jgi:proteasome lid subunit RPN8/RPN11